MTGNLSFVSKRNLPIWKGLRLPDELGDLPEGSPIFVLSEPATDPYADFGEEAILDFRLVRCLSEIGVGWVRFNGIYEVCSSHSPCNKVEG